MNFLNPATFTRWQIESRKRVRAKGRRHYVIVRGILGFGGSMFVVMTAWDWRNQLGWRVGLIKIVIGLIIWSVVGYFFGDYVWHRFYEAPQAEGKSPLAASPLDKSD